MSKRKITLLVAIGILAMGITAGAVLAQEGGESGVATATTFAGRVATILGLEEEVVKDAFAQATRQKRDEVYKSKLDKMVARGRLTEEQAEERFSWFQTRPDDPAGSFRHDRRGRYSFGQGGFRGQGRWWNGMRGPRHGWPGFEPNDVSPTAPAPENSETSS